MTPRDWAIIGLLVLTAVMVVRWHLMSVNMGLGKPLFRSQRRARDLTRLSQEGYELSDDGIVICKTCGENWCGQCGDSRIGFTFTEYKERYWA